MRPLRWLALLLLRGPHADLIRHDLDELYVRSRAQGVPWWRAQWRYARHLLDSTYRIWRGDADLGPAAHDLSAPRRGLLAAGGTMAQDVRFALRLFRKHPGPVSIATGGLAIAIGVVTAVFSIVNATMLRPYGMDDASSIVRVARAGSSARIGLPYAQVLQLREAATLGTVEASDERRVRFSTSPASGDATERLMLFVTGRYLQMLGGRPALGRTLGPADDAPGAPPVIVVSHYFWMTALNGDPSVIGRTVWVNRAAVTLVGVLRPDFTGPVKQRPAMWAPFGAFDDAGVGEAVTPASRMRVETVVRLSPGVTLQVMEEQLSAIVRSNAPQSQVTDDPSRQAVRVYSAASPLSGQAEADDVFSLVVVFAIVGLVLALACANTANLLMAAAVTRMKEIGVRLAMGATRGRLMRQMINESLLLGSVAGALGFVLAIWLVPMLGATIEVAPDVSLAPDGRVLFFTAAIALLCGLGAGLSPARFGARGNTLSALQSQSGSQSPGGFGARSRLRTSFVGFQAGVSALLLVFALLLARTALVMARADVGFDADRLIGVSLEPVQRGLDQAAYLRAALSAVRELPSVERASVTEYLPFGGFGSHRRFTHDGKSFAVTITYSDGDFFATTGVRLLRGRTFTAEEVAREAPVAVISDAVARAFFAERDPIGQLLASVPAFDNPRQDPVTIVGVAAEALLDGPDTQAFGAIYRPPRQGPRALQAFTDQGFPIPPSLLVRTATPGTTAHAIEEALRRVDARVRPRTAMIRDGLNAYLGAKRTFAWVFGPTAILAFLLAALGVYGVTAFTLSQRTAEVSVRMAMGASSADVLRMLVTDSLRPVAIGVVAGLGVALLGAQVMARAIELAGISPHDPTSVAVAAALILAGALAAVVMPARRAASTDPSGLLRQV